MLAGAKRCGRSNATHHVYDILDCTVNFAGIQWLCLLKMIVARFWLQITFVPKVMTIWSTATGLVPDRVTDSKADHSQDSALQTSTAPLCAL